MLLRDWTAVWTSSPTSNARGLIHDATDREALAKRLVDGPIGVYVGFDPTADSLHVGHLIGQLSCAASSSPATARSRWPAGPPA